MLGVADDCQKIIRLLGTQALPGMLVNGGEFFYSTQPFPRATHSFFSFFNEIIYVIFFDVPVRPMPPSISFASIGTRR